MLVHFLPVLRICHSAILTTTNRVEFQTKMTDISMRHHDIVWSPRRLSWLYAMNLVYTFKRYDGYMVYMVYIFFSFLKAHLLSAVERPCSSLVLAIAYVTAAAVNPSAAFRSRFIFSLQPEEPKGQLYIWHWSLLPWMKTDESSLATLAERSLEEPSKFCNF